MRRTPTWAKRVVGLTVTAISIYLILPSVIASFSSWPQLARLRQGSLLLMTALAVLSLGCFWILLGLCLRSRQWGVMAMSQLAATAIAHTVPGGAATATAVQYRLLRDADIDERAAGTGLTVVTLLNFAVLFAMPVLALPAILFGPPIDAALVNGAVVAAISFVAALLLGGLLLRYDSPLRSLGSAVDRVVGWTRPERESDSLRARTFVESRDLVRGYLSARWHWVIVASVGKWTFEYLALVLAVRGTGHDETTSVLLLAFVSASLLGRIPLTPGGLGFVEAGLTGMLVLAGVSPGDAATATLAYRLVTYWLPIPVGAGAYAWYRWRNHRRRGVDLPRLIDVAPESAD